MATQVGAAAEGEGGDRPVRFATYNAALNRFEAGELITDLSTPDDPQAQAVAEVIQATRPEVLLLNEVDHDPDGESVRLLQQNYLGVAQGGGEPIEYPYVYVAPSNTGVASGHDLNNDGEVGGPDDAYGFGFFEGQYGMAVLSQHPILTDEVRTFQHFRWADMPGAALPDDPSTPEPADWFSPEELEDVRLSSKSHWDVPVEIDGAVVHLLASHPTPPTFDGEEDRNGLRNHDEIRFWADYVDPGASGYIYDDAGGEGGLGWFDSFVIVGDQNADPIDGDSTGGAIDQLLDSDLVNTSVVPASDGGAVAAELQGGFNDDHAGDPAADTADFGDEDGPGNLRVDYVLPDCRAEIADAGVHWPAADDGRALVEAASDHRLVWVDLARSSWDRRTGDAPDVDEADVAETASS
ncbi:MAG: endonuclease/exonuclease/phosphatase family protein [Actinomycetota bacterium]|nr:endonuclease/exonuclease/phosphatase family protein [Actinomycetota bacterium]